MHQLSLIRCCPVLNKAPHFRAQKNARAANPGIAPLQGSNDSRLDTQGFTALRPLGYRISPLSGCRAEGCGTNTVPELTSRNHRCGAVRARTLTRSASEDVTTHSLANASG